MSQEIRNEAEHSLYEPRSQAEVLAAAQVLLTAGVPPLLLGDPGTGKTQTVVRTAQAAGWHPEVVITSLMDPTDFGGLPVRTEEGVVFEPPAWAKRVANHPGTSLVFFDELTTATPATQNAAMRVLLEGVIGDLDISGKAIFMAAANPIEQNIGSWDLSAPLANRLAFLNWVVRVDEWELGLLDGWPTVEPLHMPGESRAAAIGHMKGVLVQFIKTTPDALIKVPEASDTDHAWPSPRSWERMAEALGIADTANVSERVRGIIASSLVGPAAANQFLEFEQKLDLIETDRLLDDPKLFAQMKRSDQQHTALNSVVFAIQSDPAHTRWADGMRVCIEAANVKSPDIAAEAARRLNKLRPAGAGLPDGFGVFHEVLSDAGLIADREERVA